MCVSQNSVSVHCSGMHYTQVSSLVLEGTGHTACSLKTSGLNFGGLTQMPWLLKVLSNGLHERSPCNVIF